MISGSKDDSVILLRRYTWRRQLYIYSLVDIGSQVYFWVPESLSFISLVSFPLNEYDYVTPINRYVIGTSQVCQRLTLFLSFHARSFLKNIVMGSKQCCVLICRYSAEKERGAVAGDQIRDNDDLWHPRDRQIYTEFLRLLKTLRWWKSIRERWSTAGKWKSQQRKEQVHRSLRRITCKAWTQSVVCTARKTKTPRHIDYAADPSQRH